MNNEFGDFNIISNTYRKGTATYAKFKCKLCGREKEAPYYRMKDNNKGANNHEKSCLKQEEIERKKENINSNDFGDFILLKDLGNRSEKDRHRIGLFKCKICGREKEVKIHNMAKGIGTSHMYCINDPNVKFTPQFKSKFNAMKNRCNDINNDRYHRYGGRGIKCDYEYLIDFYDDFYDMYLKHVSIYGESETTIDRINVDGNYTNDNIKFATNLEQSRNRSDMRSVKVTDTLDNTFLYFNSIGYAAEYYDVPRTNLDNALYHIKNPTFGNGRYRCEYYDGPELNRLKIILPKLKPLIEFID